MKSSTILGFLGVSSMAVFATGCGASDAGSQTDSLGEAQQAMTTDTQPTDSAVAAAIAQKKREATSTTSSAGASSSQMCSMDTSGCTMDQLVTVPAGSTVTCTTVGNTTLDTVLALMLYGNDWSSTRGPGDSPYTDIIQWYMLAFNDDSSGTSQSTVSWTNNTGVDRTPRLIGFLYSGSNGGTINVTCTINGSTTTYSGNFASGSGRGYPSSSEVYTTANVGNPDTTLLLIVNDLSNQNSKSNDDCPDGSTPDSRESCITGVTTGALTWCIDLGCYGDLPRTTTVWNM